ncbi:glycosyltransferase [Microlunatus spumicola]|uniref:4,4'-diaponeurosporenoate glycosyltransferase n=1 Tax=Microlunatus spumicola TaxID=81499 RepID=A0ABP6XST3_9ACTN
MTLPPVQPVKPVRPIQPVQPFDVVVAVPARDEEASVETCLRSVVAAAQHALRTGAVARVRIALAAHRSRDATALRASAYLATTGLDHLVLVDESSDTVGAVRAGLVEAAMAASPRLAPSRTWLLSTDADSVVPTDWVVGLLDVAARTGADLVAGFVALDGWVADPGALAAYDHLLQAGLTAEGHDHVWAANLAVAYPAYAAAGGFPSVVHGEERVLARRVTRAGGKAVGALHPVVTTSARMPGRAAHGLGDLLRRLADAEEEAS